MSILFWGVATAMLVAAIGLVVIPLKSGKGITGISRVTAAVLFAVLALGLYAILGSPGTLVTGNTPLHPGKVAAPVGALIDGLRSRLQNEPDDADGWLLLARSYDHLGRHEEASFAYQRARSLGKTDMGREASLSGSITTVPEGPPSALPALRGRIVLAPGAATLVEPDDTVFIFAKESPEQRMPVVALRKPVADLPIDFVLTDKHVMVPGTSLASFETLVVTARVSRSGRATDSIEGTEVWSKPVSPVSGEKIELVITAGPPTGEPEDE